jgi:hypothetical protein
MIDDVRRLLVEYRWAPVALALAGLGILLWLYRRRRARTVARQWLAAHRYGVRRLSIPWWHFRGWRFGPALTRNNNRAFEVRADVVDEKLGGHGVVWLRVWIGLGGDEIHDTEVFWETMPDAERQGDSSAGGAPWEQAQLELLRRVASGERTFRPDRHGEEDGEQFDLLIEHILAMQRRGLLTCATPVAETRRSDRRYAFVSDVRLTPEGERVAQATER